MRQLTEWFLSEGGFVHENLSLQFSSDFGYHFVSTSNLDCSVTVCTCPFALTLSHLNCLESPPDTIKSFASTSICQHLTGRVPDTAVATFFLAEQRLKGKESFFHPYITTLPKEEHLTTPLWMQPNDLVWLYGTNLHSMTGQNDQTAIGLRRSMYHNLWKQSIDILTQKGIDCSLFTW